MPLQLSTDRVVLLVLVGLAFGVSAEAAQPPAPRGELIFPLQDKHVAFDPGWIEQENAP